MRTLRISRRGKAAQVAAQAIFFLALLGAFALGMMSSRPQVAALQMPSKAGAIWKTGGVVPKTPAPGTPCPSEAENHSGASMRGVLEALPVQ